MGHRVPSEQGGTQAEAIPALPETPVKERETEVGKVAVVRAILEMGGPIGTGTGPAGGICGGRIPGPAG